MPGQGKKTLTLCLYPAQAMQHHCFYRYEHQDFPVETGKLLIITTALF